MALDFEEAVFKGLIKPSETAFGVEEVLRTKFGFGSRYESAQLMLARSLAAPPPGPSALAAGTTFAKSLPGEQLFSGELDLWIVLLVLDGDLGVGAGVEDFRALVEAHWHRGALLLREDLEQCSGDPAKLASLLSDYLPEAGGNGARTGGAPTPGVTGEIRMKVGSVSRTLAGDKPVDFAAGRRGSKGRCGIWGRTES